jgi:hypothetical protein
MITLSKVSREDREATARNDHGVQPERSLSRHSQRFPPTARKGFVKLGTQSVNDPVLRVHGTPHSNRKRGSLMMPVHLLARRRRH